MRKHNWLKKVCNEACKISARHRENVVSGQADDKYWRNMLTLLLYDARVVGANDALMSSCSKPAVSVALVGPGFWLEWGRARGLSVWLSRTAKETDGRL